MGNMWTVVAVDKFNEAVTVAFAGSDHRVSVHVPAGLTEEQASAHIAEAVAPWLVKATVPERADLSRLLVQAELGKIAAPELL